MKDTVLIVIGLAVATLGVQLSITSTNFIVTIISLVVGTIIGEWLNIEDWLKKIVYKVESSNPASVQSDLQCRMVYARR